MLKQKIETVMDYSNADSTERHTFWLVPYGNMMTILMIFFLVLYAFATQNKLKVKQVSKSIEESITDKDLKKDIEKLGLLGEFRQFMWDNNLNQFIEVSANARRILISMQGHVLFKPGGIELNAQGKKVLGKVALLIESEVGEVRVSGHTDNTPITSGKLRDNWELSGKRAYNVVKYFTQDHQLIPMRFSLNGYGEYAPIAPNDTPEHQALNRRIEINIVKKRKLWTQ